MNIDLMAALRESLENARAVARTHFEPYRGVRALFNADLHVVMPEWAPREDWIVLDAHTIECVKPVGER